MGRFDVNVIRYLQKDHFRVLIAVEMGMKNHELVPLQLVASVAGIHRGAVARNLADLQKHRLVIYERGKRADGYRLTNFGYDFLALKALCLRGAVGAIGNQIGVGKESDVFVGGDPELNDLVLKFHRLGRTSFRKLKEKRDYHRGRKNCSWLYLARLAASKEFAFLKALHDHKFPVPRPIDVCRHTVVMGFIDGLTLCHVHELEDAAGLYDKLMSLVVRLGRYGLIHGDFNEFNIVLKNDGEPVLIDFPQMVSTDHPNAEYYFNRDVECVRIFFRRRFNFDSECYPKFEDVRKKYSLDVEVAASGFTKQMAKDLNAAYDAGDFDEIDAEQSSSSSEAESFDEQEGDSSDEVEKSGSTKRVFTRLNAWLQDAQDHLDGLKIGTCDDCPEIHPKENYNEGMEESNTVDLEEDKGYDEVLLNARPSSHLIQTENRKAEINVQLSVAEKTKEDEASPGRNEGEFPTIDATGNAQKANSTFSVGSTIAREDICKRLALEQRAKSKTKLRLKGKASAVRRGRKTNMAVIKEYAVWDF